MKINIPDINASALISEFKNAEVILTIATMTFVVVTQTLNWDITWESYMMLIAPLITLITGKTVSTVASSKTTTTNGGTNSGS